jgi:hypothetical protein
MSDHAYATAWKRYRRLRLNCWVAFAGFALSTFTLVFADLPPVRFGWAALAFWVYAMIAGSRLRGFPCPRCGKYFKRRWPSEKRFPSGSCPHCGLEKFAKEGRE